MLKIDIHTHILPAEIPNFKEKFGYGGFIQLHPCQKCTGRDMIDDSGKFFRRVDENAYTPSIRLQQYDRFGVDVQVLSTVPVMFSYWAKPHDALEVSRFLNDHIADTVRTDPKRFVGLGTLPMNAPDLAVIEAERCVKKLGLRGFQIGSHVNDLNLSAPELFPIFKKIEELGACLFVHPWDMMGQEKMQKYWLPWLVGMPAETSLAICSMIFGGVFERFPKLRVAFAHGGGSFPLTFDRIQHGFEVRPDLCALDNPHPPQKYLKHFWVDSLVHGDAALGYLINLFGPEKICLGSDYPFPLGELRPGELIEKARVDEAAKQWMFSKSALAWLNMNESDFK